MCYYFSKSKSVVTAREELTSQATQQAETNDQERDEETDAERTLQMNQHNGETDRKCA